jgi:hypothetical protein
MAGHGRKDYRAKRRPVCVTADNASHYPILFRQEEPLALLRSQ